MLVVVVFETGAVELVCTALRLDVDHGAAGQPLLGVETVGGHVHAVDRLQGRDHGRPADIPDVRIRRSVHIRHRGGGGRAVHTETQGSGWIASGEPSLALGPFHFKTGKGREQALVVASQGDGQVGEVCSGDLAPDIAALGLKWRELRVGGYGYRRLDSGQLQDGIHANRTIHADGDVRLRKIGKARHAHRDGICAGGNVGKTIQALFIRLRAASQVDLLIDDGHFGAASCPVRLVGDISDQRSVQHLGGARTGRENEQERQKRQGESKASRVGH